MMPQCPQAARTPHPRPLSRLSSTRCCSSESSLRGLSPPVYQALPGPRWADGCSLKISASLAECLSPPQKILMRTASYEAGNVN